MKKRLYESELPVVKEFEPLSMCPDISFEIRMPEYLQNLKAPITLLNDAKERFNNEIKAKKKEISKLEVRLTAK
jgi:hypothetical protein